MSRMDRFPVAAGRRNARVPIFRGALHPIKQPVYRCPILSLTSGLLGVKSRGLKGKTSKSVLTDIVILRYSVLVLEANALEFFGY